MWENKRINPNKENGNRWSFPTNETCNQSLCKVKVNQSVVALCGTNICIDIESLLEGFLHSLLRLGIPQGLVSTYAKVPLQSMAAGLRIKTTRIQEERRVCFFPAAFPQ